MNERWKARSSGSLREKPVEASPTVGGSSPRAASGSALAPPLREFSARPRAGCGDRQPGGSPAPSGVLVPTARSRPLRGRNQVISAEVAAATGVAGGGRGKAAKFAGLSLLNPHGCVGVLIHLSQPGSAPLCASSGGLVSGPLCGCGCMRGCLRKPLRSLLATHIGPQLGERLREPRALPVSRNWGRIHRRRELSS